VSDPGRDRREAGRPRYGPRWARGIDEEIGRFMASPEVARARRFERVAAALAEVLDDRERALVRPLKVGTGRLWLEVHGAPLLAELRQYRPRQLVDALVRHRTGITEIRFRPARRPRRR